MIKNNLSITAFLKENLYKVLLLVFLVFACYVNSLGNDFVSDDFAFIYLPNFGTVSSFLYNHAPFFSPINFVRFLISFLGRSPFLFRSVNILFHTGSVVLIYFLISQLFNKKLGFFTAAVFAVHPILIESITWIAGGPYSQYGFLLIFSLTLYYLAFRNNFQKKFYLSSLILFVLALLSNEKAIVFPVVILFFELCYGNIKNNWKMILPFFGFSFVLGIYLFSALGNRYSTIQTSVYTQLKIINPVYQIPIAITSYLSLIVLPVNLSFYHSEMTFATVQYIVRLSVFLAFTGLTVFFFFKNKKVFFWLAFFPIILSPTLTPFGISWIVAERYVYLACLGIIVPIGMLFVKLYEKINKNIFFVIFSIIIVSLSTRTIIRNTDWKNQDTLWIATAKTAPSSPQNHNNLGDLYGRRGDLNRAIEEFQTAIILLPDYADAYHNLANTYVQIGKIDLAIENYKKAIHYNPQLWQSYLNLASLYFDLEKYDDSVAAVQESIKINPQNPNNYLLLGADFLKQNKTAEAKTQFLNVLKLDPNNQGAIKLLNSLNQKQEAGGGK